jgi:hypothetical protein
MEISDKLLDRINKFLLKHKFQLYLDFFKFSTEFIVQLTGTKNYISIGQEKEMIEYTLYILPSNHQSDTFWGYYRATSGKDLPITSSDPKFLMIRGQIENLLSKSLSFFGIENGFICTKIVILVDALD